MLEGSEKIYRVVIENVPENTRIFYKFFKFNPYLPVLHTDWETLDYDNFSSDRHNNRVVDVRNRMYLLFVLYSSVYDFITRCHWELSYRYYYIGDLTEKTER